MAVLIAHASIDENNRARGGQAGDQTGKEVCIREWYNKPWNVMIRFNDPVMASKVADCMEMAAANIYIGYDQNQRNTLLTKARKYNYDVSKVKEPCETDCSALVSVACMYAGIPESALTYNGNCLTTRTLRAGLKATGEVSVYTTIPYLAKPDKLKRGDILIKEGSHVVVVVKTGDEPLKKSAQEIALEIIQGKGNWGNGVERRIRLTEAGYNYSIVQSYVNDFLKVKKEVDNERLIWDYLMPKIGNPYGVAGLIGNLKAESGLNPKNLQNTFEKRMSFTDDSYTAAVDNGAYKNFATDSAGYGLAQWTSSGRKQALLNSKGSRSIGDIEMQLNFLWVELTTSYKNVLSGIKSAKSVREASDIVLTKFERPKDQSEGAKEYRAKLGAETYQKFI